MATANYKEIRVRLQKEMTTMMKKCDEMCHQVCGSYCTGRCDGIWDAVCNYSKARTEATRAVDRIDITGADYARNPDGTFGKRCIKSSL